ncbi:marine proteobacterial sortase target protein [Rhizobium sp. Root483D2]|uniref:marine proteobacterial sortase target protein n=1 Tax=Rhizobium sp. Root483D2 TaxID=1736545 RepID=UPI0007132C07|nr:marine proteobacterial sortase target protein [Rhizobium sp. Root483D2]KQY34748.1 marine proteobacterial sortase target protein [Rhizobium sp. Root483D2]
MLLNTENTAKPVSRMSGRQIEYLIVAALIAVTLSLLFFMGFFSHAMAETNGSKPQRFAGYVRPNDMGTGALLFPSKEPGSFVEAPRLATDVVIDVNGPIIRTRVTQRFENPSKGWVEGTYVFPLPENSAVDTLKMQIGDRFIEGEIKAREEARKVYEQAKAEGKKTALLEQQRPNIFTNQVANIGPGETIVVQIEYQSSVHQSGGEFSLRFPMVVAPRYNPDPIVQTVDLDPKSGYAVNDPVPDRDKITSPVLNPAENAKINPVTLTVNLNAGFPLGTVTSPFHQIDMQTVDGTARKISLKSASVPALKNASVPADKDFELSWNAVAGAMPNAGLFRETQDGKTYLLGFVTPPAQGATDGTAPDREVVFVIDNSGSMAGPSIEQARDSLALAISKLRPQDKFNVVRFDDTMEVHFPTLVQATPDRREDAIAFVRGLTADGGTEMLPALEAALRTQGPVASGALRQVVFLTDGAIGNEAQLFEEISSNRGDARVFTVGIGSAPNTHFMTKAAEIGRGTFTLIGSEDQVAARMGELFAKLENPVMTDIAVSFDGANAQDITPNPMPDLYRGEPVVLTAQLEGATPTGKLQITGKSGTQPWRIEMDVAKASQGKGIAKLWARRKIDDLEANAYAVNDAAALDKQIETVALANHLVSRVTSLVAVDVTPSRPAGEPVVSTDLPLNLPEGWDFEKVFGEEPQPTMPQGERKAQLQQSEQQAMLVADRMAAAPTARAASMIADAGKQVNLPQTATLADRHILIGLMLLAFAVMAATTFSLWRWQLRGLVLEGRNRVR